MNYEMAPTLNPDSPTWAAMVASVQKTDGKMLGLLSQPGLRLVLQKAAVSGTNIIDLVTGRTIDPDSYLFFNQVPVPTGSKVIINDDWTVSVIYNGDEIAQEKWFQGTRRSVRELKYLNADGTTDYLEEYAADGKLHSTLYYDDGKLQEIAFCDDAQRVVLQYFFYEGKLNFVTVTNPDSGQVESRYATMNDFLIETLADFLKPQDTVVIRYMARELTVLRRSRSYNILVLSEPPRDESGQIRGNLAAILNNEIDWIHEVRVSPAYYEDLEESGLPMTKVKQEQ